MIPYAYPQGYTFFSALFDYLHNVYLLSSLLEETNTC